DASPILRVGGPQREGRDVVVEPATAVLQQSPVQPVEQLGAAPGPAAAASPAAGRLAAWSRLRYAVV
ncbi:hypothetical protein, partial [Streptomyces afghaniensis]|uniref:hypothetical protein n=1 Tax=Streptomyces afghaniensis TaxID=66865 RepID=UPI0024694A4E